MVPTSSIMVDTCKLRRPFDTCQYLREADVMAVTRGDSRARILDTAWGLVRERGIDAVTVADIAAASGVSRQLLYVHFENRAGLLKAMARRHDVRSGFAGRAAETGSLPPVAALERLLRLWFAYLPEILPVARALEAAAVGRLAAGWTTTAASDWIWARAQPSTFAHLVVDRAWPAADYTERAVRSILSEVVSPEA